MELPQQLRSQIEFGNEAIGIALSFSLRYTPQMLAELIEVLANKLKQKDTTQIDALEKIKMETRNRFEVEKQQREMDHASKLADKESQRHHFDATVILAGHALKSAILINGGAAIAMLTFIGHELQLPKLSRLTFAHSLGLYVAGVFLAAIATGFSYKAQDRFMESGKRDRSFNIWLTCAILAIILSYFLFGAGSWCAYSGFIDLPE